MFFWDPSYEMPRWHATLMMIGFTVLTLLLNLFLRRIFNVLETLGGVFHVLFFVAIIAIMATLGERSSPEFVFTELVSGVSGWTNPGVCFNIGLLTTLLPLTGADSVLHMSK